jgi:hypothetical protein
MAEKKKDNLVTKLAAIMDSIDSVAKRGKNKEQGYSFVRAADVANICRKKLAAANIIVIANEVERKDGEYQTLKGTMMFTVHLRIEYTLIDGDSGERITFHGWGDAADASDKSVNKCKTASLKYALRTLFLIPDDSDPEADGTVDHPANQRTADPYTEKSRQEVETVRCEKCTNPIGSFKKMKNGEVVEIIPAQKVVAASKLNHAGKVYCGNCQIALAKAGVGGKDKATEMVEKMRAGKDDKKEAPAKKKGKKAKEVDPNDIVTIVPKDVKPAGRKFTVTYDLPSGVRGMAGCWSSTIAGILREHIDENCDVVIKTTTKGNDVYYDISDILKAGEFLVEDGELVVRRDEAELGITENDTPKGLFGDE